MSSNSSCTRMKSPSPIDLRHRRHPTLLDLALATLAYQVSKGARESRSYRLDLCKRKVRPGLTAELRSFAVVALPRGSSWIALRTSTSNLERTLQNTRCCSLVRPPPAFVNRLTCPTLRTSSSQPQSGARRSPARLVDGVRPLATTANSPSAALFSSPLAFCPFRDSIP